ncbi:MAG TPA: hypothetical protein VFP55_08670 [Solirubrobacteraceae bacterium]|nr:hypothetical protein [Solirubrobacteraceae bacterium]
MTTVLIVLCIVLCVGVILAIVGHLGHGVASDRRWRGRVNRDHVRKSRRRTAA